ncbi:MAG: type II secretion system secretin GspD [Sedimentisphaerales bacterium]|nr:type II secretion system secretin GspD [Sedimentisphaerales bacterium]
MADRSVARPLEAGAALAGIATVGDAAPEISSAVSVDMPAIDSPEMADQLVSLNFDKVDINAVLKTIGDITGINFVVDKSVSGPVTVMSPTKIRLGDVYTVLESILDVQGYAAVPSGDLVKIVPKAQAAKRSLQVRIGSDPEQMPDTDSVVTQIIPLSYADAAEVAGIVKPFAAAESQIATYPRTNSIVVTDTSSNIRYLTTIIHRLDVPGSKEAALVIPLKYASAQVLSEQILQIMDERSTAAGQSSRNRTQQGDTAMKILADDRTNSLIIVAAPQDIDTIRGLVEQLDVQRPIGSNNVHVVYLQNAQSKEVAQSLTAALTNLRISGAIEASKPVQVTSDEGTNAVIISASAQDFEVIGEIIEKLDIVREQVLVEMQIIEVSEDSLKEIGVDWASLDQSVDGSVRVFGATGFGLRSGFASGTLEGLALGAWRGAGTNRQIGTILHALQKVSGVNILSTPHILTSNHQKAMIVVGENRPFVMQSRITETGDLITPTVIKTYEYKDVGISLEITPHISQGGLIRLEVDTEFTKLIDDVTTTSTDTPATAKRQAQTVISMDSGSTVVIGGLIRDDITNIKKKVPLLGDIPVVGSLFRFRRDKLQKTNLLLFITPYRLGNQLDLEKITNKKKDEMAPVLEENQKKDETGRK